MLDAVIQKWKCLDNNPFYAKFNKLGLSWARLSKIGTELNANLFFSSVGLTV